MSHELWFTTPAPDWFEALPLGNGQLGAKVFGQVENERIALNLDDLWSGDGPAQLQVTDGPEVLADIRRLLLTEGDRLAATERTRALQGRLVESFQPLGDLLISDLAPESPVEDYRRSLDLRDGVVSVAYRRGGVRFERETFVSTPDHVMVWTVRADSPGSVDTRISLTSQHPVRVTPVDGTTAAVTGHAPSDLTIEYRTSPEPIRYRDGHGIGFAVAMRAYAEGGRLESDESGIVVRGADSLTIVLAAASTFDGWRNKPGSDPAVALQQSIDLLDSATRAGVEKLRQRHVEDHQTLYDRGNLTLESPRELVQKPTDERIRLVAAGGNDPDLVGLVFAFGRYLLMASSRPGTQPANLQGIWNEDRRPMWASDWTNNINTQMNYWPAEVTGLSDCVEPLIRLVSELAEAGQDTARMLYGAPGWVTHHNTDIWRATWPVGEGGDDPVWAMAATCGVWLSAHLMEHYRFHPDLDFLRGTAYPILAGAAEFALALLVEDADGRLQFVPSTSPEHHFILPTGEKVSVDLTTTYDIWVLRELFGNVLEATELLGMESELAGRIRAASTRLPEIPLGPDGRIQEWPVDWQPSEPDHRHQSHLYGLYPGLEIDPVGTPELAAAARGAIAARTATGTPGGGWTSAWFVAIWARLLEPEKAAAVVRKYVAELVSDNLLHRDGDIFQIDANLGMTGAIAELLIQSHTQVIRLLPALPSEWPDGSFRGLRARGGLSFDLQWQAGRITGAWVTSDLGGTIRLSFGADLQRTVEVTLTPGERRDLTDKLSASRGR
jgi:alpha-L-fucosidase 2